MDFNPKNKAALIRPKLYILQLISKKYPGYKDLSGWFALPVTLDLSDLLFTPIGLLAYLYMKLIFFIALFS